MIEYWIEVGRQEPADRRRDVAHALHLREGEVGGELAREGQDADREDDRDDAGEVDPERQERLAALVHPPAANAAGVLDRDPPLALLDVDDHGDGDDREDGEQDDVARRRRLEGGEDAGRGTAHDAREDDEADAVADALLGDQLTEPHQQDGAGDEREHLDPAHRVAEAEAAEDDALGAEGGQDAERLQEGHRDGQVAGVLVQALAPVLALPAERLERRDHARHELHDDRGVDVRVHREPDDGQLRQPAAREQVQDAERRVVLEELGERLPVDARAAGPGR